MGRSKKFNPKQNRNKPKSGRYQSALGSDDETLYQNESDDNDGSGNSSDDLYDDEVDEFHKNKQKELLKNSSLNIQSDDEDQSQSEEEILPLAPSSSDDDDDDQIQDNDDDDDDDDEYDNKSKTKLSRFEIEYKKDEMASDLDTSDDDEDGLPDAKAWGKKKSFYYNTDYVDKDFREYKETDERLATYEEEEALAIQKRLLQSMNDADLGIDLLVGDVEPKKEELHLKEQIKDDEKEILHLDINMLSEREKIDLLKKESPELEILINDFNTYLSHIKNKLEPLMGLVRTKKIPNHTVSQYIQTRYHLITHYCTNILFYLGVKSKPSQTQEQVLKKLQKYKKLVKELDNISNKCPIDNDLNLVVNKLKRGEDINFDISQISKRKSKVDEHKPIKKVKFSDDVEMHLNEDKIESLEDNVEENDKRAITYEIAKNKGLTPKRKKELRNPRVKYRMKYRKAKIRRKGQVREPRKEIKKYDGEYSGIKSRVVKSIKFK